MKLTAALALTAALLSSCATTTPTTAEEARKAAKIERIADRVGPRN